MLRHALKYHLVNDRAAFVKVSPTQPADVLHSATAVFTIWAKWCLANQLER